MWDVDSKMGHMYVITSQENRAWGRYIVGYTRLEYMDLLKLHETSLGHVILELYLPARGSDLEEFQLLPESQYAMEKGDGRWFTESLEGLTDRLMGFLRDRRRAETYVPVLVTPTDGEGTTILVEGARLLYYYNDYYWHVPSPRPGNFYFIGGVPLPRDDGRCACASIVDQLPRFCRAEKGPTYSLVIEDVEEAELMAYIHLTYCRAEYYDRARINVHLCPDHVCEWSDSDPHDKDNTLDTYLDSGNPTDCSGNGSLEEVAPAIAMD